MIADRRVDNAFDFAVAKLGLGLPLELRFGNAGRDDRRQAFAEILARGHEVLEHVLFLAVGVERAGQRCAEAGNVRAPLDGADVVYVRVDILGVFAGVLHGDIETDAVEFALDVDDLGVQRFAGPIEILDELDDPALVAESLALVGPFVAEDDLHALVEERQLLQSAVERRVIELRLGKDLRIGLEGGFRAALVGRTKAADLGHRHTPFVLLLVHVPAAADLNLAPLREKIDHGDAHTVQAAGSLVGALGELAAELEHRHHALQRGKTQVRMDLDGNAAAVVFNRHRTVVVDNH